MPPFPSDHPPPSMAEIDKEAVEIRDVWAHNLDAEIALIREIVDDYPYVAMDTEFPGIAIRPVGGEAKTVAEANYHVLRSNVDILHLIQLGLAFSDADGNLPTSAAGRPVLWQFNFREFDDQSEVFNPDSIELLRKSGIDFRKNREHGISASRFGELLMSSGVVLNDSVHWVAFHCPYDFGYLLKILTGRNLPETREVFFDLVKVFFAILYDIKHMIKFTNGLHGGLNNVASMLGVQRVGVSHQAGSDSLVTLRVFHKLLRDYFDGDVDRYAGVLHGLDSENLLKK